PREKRDHSNSDRDALHADGPPLLHRFADQRREREGEVVIVLRLHAQEAVPGADRHLLDGEDGEKARRRDSTSQRRPTCALSARRESAGEKRERVLPHEQPVPEKGEEGDLETGRDGHPRWNGPGPEPHGKSNQRRIRGHPSRIAAPSRWRVTDPPAFHELIAVPRDG